MMKLDEIWRRNDSARKKMHIIARCGSVGLSINIKIIILFSNNAKSMKKEYSRLKWRIWMEYKLLQISRELCIYYYVMIIIARCMHRVSNRESDHDHSLLAQINSGIASNCDCGKFSSDKNNEIIYSLAGHWYRVILMYNSIIRSNSGKIIGMNWPHKRHQ